MSFPFVSSVKEIESAIQSGDDVNKQSSRGDTALYILSQQNDKESVQKLLSLGEINVNIQNTFKDTSFYVAAYQDKFNAFFEMLKDARVDINLPNYVGWSPLMIATYYSNKKIIQYLLSFGRKVDFDKLSVGVDAEIKVNSSAMDIAKKRKDTALIELFTNYKKNPKQTQTSLRNLNSLQG